MTLLYHIKNIILQYGISSKQFRATQRILTISLKLLSSSTIHYTVCPEKSGTTRVDVSRLCGLILHDLQTITQIALYFSGHTVCKERIENHQTLECLPYKTTTPKMRYFSILKNVKIWKLKRSHFQKDTFFTLLLKFFRFESSSTKNIIRVNCC